jgi:hypothetical protein
LKWGFFKKSARQSKNILLFPYNCGNFKQSNYLNMVNSTQTTFLQKWTSLLLVLTLLVGFQAKAQTITTGNLPQSSFCPCNTYQVNFTSTGAFNPGNNYTAELSNAAGSFASPVVVGSISSSANSGTIAATIPCNTPNGTQYRIRVVSDNPVTIGTDNGSNMTIMSNPNAPLSVTSNPAGLCDPGGTVQLSATSLGNSINWYSAAVGGNYLGNSPSATGFPSSLTSTTTYYAEALVGGIAVSGSSTFGFTGGMQTFIVPPGITSVQIECYGGQGSAALSAAPGLGGLGAYASGSLTVTPGQVLNIFVGGQGGIPTGGYNGGGNGGDASAGGGGGATDVRVGGITLGNRVIVAGGGGGGGTSSDGCPGVFMGGNGGVGGGGAGLNGMNSPSGGGGFGGNVGVGGAPGMGCANFMGTAGTVPNGGDGMTIGCSNVPGGGGGGGGYLVGGGGGGGTLGTPACTGNEKGGGGGGAGGSSFTGTLTNSSTAQGFNIGNGSVIITWSGSPTTCVSATRTPVTVPVNPIPNVTATPITSTVCPNAPVTLSGGGASTYSWNGPQTITNNVAFPATVSGIYTVTGTSAAGCTSTATANVTVINLVVNANASPASSVCIGDQVTLSGTGANTYSWTGGITNNVAFVPTVGTTTYTVTGTDGNGCTNTSTINVTSNPLPSAPAGLTSNPVSLCNPGGSVNLTAISTNNSINWFNAPTGGVLLGNSLSGAPYSTTLSTTTTYYAETSLIGVGGCVSSVRTPITVVVNPLPTVTSTPNLINGCNNITITLAGSGANSYSWAGPQSVQDNVPFLATTSGLYLVTGTDGNGCTNTATVAVNVNPLPLIGITSAPSAEICQGASVTLFGTNGLSYAWTGGITNGTPFAPNVTTTYTVTGTDVNGCTSTSSITAVVNPSVAPIIALSSNPTVVYGGTSTTYIATVPISVGSYQLDWYRGNTFFTTTYSPTNTITFTPASQDDSVYVMVTPLSGCYFPAVKQSNTILVRFPMSIEGLDIPGHTSVNIQGVEMNDQMVLTDVVGQVLSSVTFKSNGLQTIDLSQYTNGMYHARFNRNGKNWVIKLIKE